LKPADTFAFLRCRLAATKFRLKKKKETDLMDRDAEAITVHNDLISRDIANLKRRALELKSFMLNHKVCYSKANIDFNLK
jgi:hypothetical protein